jgi:hypothetical protein
VLIKLQVQYKPFAAHRQLHKLLCYWHCQLQLSWECSAQIHSLLQEHGSQEWVDLTCSNSNKSICCFQSWLVPAISPYSHATCKFSVLCLLPLHMQDVQWICDILRWCRILKNINVTLWLVHVIKDTSRIY